MPEENNGLRSDLWGLEWDFLAVDSAGHVAVLSSAGYGPIPEPVLAAREDVERATAVIGAMPTTTNAIPVHSGRDGDFSDWYAMSARGFYAYDWHVWQGPYELIAVPAEPLGIEALPDQVRAAASILQILQPFAEAAELYLR